MDISAVTGSHGHTMDVHHILAAEVLFYQPMGRQGCVSEHRFMLPIIARDNFVLNTNLGCQQLCLKQVAKDRYYSGSNTLCPTNNSLSLKNKASTR